MAEDEGKGRRGGARRRQKTARRVEIPDDRPLTLEEFADLRDHAYASAFWNVTHYSRSEKQVRDKLVSKGYVEGEVQYLSKRGEVKHFDIIEHTIEELRQRELVGDDDFARRFVSSKLGQGWGMSRIRLELLRKGVQGEVLEDCLEEYGFEDEQVEALRREVERALASSAVQREPMAFKRRQRVVQTLMRKGFNYGDIDAALREVDELEE